ncbi:hypothetical protein JCM8097_002800 [Rhodosporidiobolus ruineniae]
MDSLPAPPAGTNPYEYYRTLLHDSAFIRPSATGTAGCKARLVVLFLILAVLLVASIANFGVHVWALRIKRRRLWIFRLVERDGGKHIISNHFVLCGLGGVAMFVVLFGETYNAWRAWVSPGEVYRLQQLPKWAFAIWPTAYAAGWLLSWASYQAYMQIEGGSRALFSQQKKRSRYLTAMSASVENCLFVGGGVMAVGILAALAGVASHASDQSWTEFHILDDYLVSGAESWTDGTTVGQEEMAKAVALFASWKTKSGHSFRTASNMCIGAAILPLFLCLINLSLISFVLLVRRQIDFQLAHLPSVLSATTLAPSPNGDGTTTPSSAKEPVSPASPTFSLQKGATTPHTPLRRESLTPLAKVFDNLPTFIPLNDLSSPSSPSPTTPYSALSAVASPFSPLRHARPTSPSCPSTAISVCGAGSPVRLPPTRAQVRELADDVEAAATRGQAVAAEVQVAEKIMLLVKAERELLLIGGCILLESLLFSIVAFWSVPTLRHYPSLTFAKTEAFLTLPIWLVGVGIAIAEVGHAWIEWRYALRREWRRGRWERERTRERVRGRKRRGSEIRSSDGSFWDQHGAGGGGGAAAAGFGPASPSPVYRPDRRRPSLLAALRSPVTGPTGSVVSRVGLLGLGLGSSASSQGEEDTAPVITVEVTQQEDVEVASLAESEREEEDEAAKEAKRHERLPSWGSRADRRREVWED